MAEEGKVEKTSKTAKAGNVVAGLFGLGKWTLIMLTAASISLAIVAVAYLAYETIGMGKSVGQSISTGVEWTGRVVLGRQKHEPTPTLVRRAPWTPQDELAAIEMAKDTEGEFEHENRRNEAMARAGQMIRRAQAQGVSIEEHFRKAYMWLPFTWDHDANMARRVRWTVGIVGLGKWKDRDLETTKGGIPDDVIKRAREIWDEIRDKPADPNGCAVHMIRAKDHAFTSYDGERKARTYLLQSYSPDPSAPKGRYRTTFLCTPEDAKKLQEQMDRQKQSPGR